MLPSTFSKVLVWASLESLLCGFVKNKKLSKEGLSKFWRFTLKPVTDDIYQLINSITQ